MIRSAIRPVQLQIAHGVDLYASARRQDEVIEIPLRQNRETVLAPDLERLGEKPSEALGEGPGEIGRKALLLQRGGIGRQPRIARMALRGDEAR